MKRRPGRHADVTDALAALPHTQTHAHTQLTAAELHPNANKQFDIFERDHLGNLLHYLHSVTRDRGL